tara:strand:- start:365 stop:601 length:237 start_codon:yes stop_codon:yes gene_type:complete
MLNNITVTHDGVAYSYSEDNGAGQWLSENNQPPPNGVSDELVSIAIRSGVDSGIFSASTTTQGRSATTKQNKIKIFND